jgi:hypothetical protein
LITGGRLVIVLELIIEVRCLHNVCKHVLSDFL